MQPGIIYTTQLMISPSTETQIGVRAGTIHVQDGNATVPEPLKVKINIKEATSDDDDQVYHQGWPISDLDVTLNPNLLTVMSHLVPGRNEFILVANDTDGKLIYGEFVLWAGNQTLRGYVVDENYQLVQDATVVIKLGDNQTVTDRTTTVGGQFSFNNLPARTVILEAVATNLRVGSVAANGGQGFVYLHTRGFYSPSPIANNDFSQGLSGWEIGTAPVWLMPHEEEYQV